MKSILRGSGLGDEDGQCVCFGCVIYWESLLRTGQGLRQLGVCGCGSFRTLRKELCDWLC